MQAVYSIYTAMLELTIAEAEKAVHFINGDLNGIEYKGTECCEKEDCQMTITNKDLDECTPKKEHKYND